MTIEEMLTKAGSEQDLATMQLDDVVKLLDVDVSGIEKPDLEKYSHVATAMAALSIYITRVLDMVLCRIYELTGEVWDYDVLQPEGLENNCMSLYFQLRKPEDGEKSDDT